MERSKCCLQVPRELEGGGVDHAEAAEGHRGDDVRVFGVDEAARRGGGDLERGGPCRPGLKDRSDGGDTAASLNGLGETVNDGVRNNISASPVTRVSKVHSTASERNLLNGEPLGCWLVVEIHRIKDRLRQSTVEEAWIGDGRLRVDGLRMITYQWMK
jgi:hypothetical protein